MALGFAYDLFTRHVVVPRKARETLARSVPPVHLENVALGPALQQLADSTHPALRLSMCPDVASTRVTHTTGQKSLRDFAELVAGKAGAEVDLARRRHGVSAVPYPHLYFARSDCGTRGFGYVYVYAHEPSP